MSETHNPPDPIHWCDLLRDLERVNTTDPRYASRVVLDPELGARQMVLADHWKDIGAITLLESVPRLVRVHFETARNLLLYSWFVYRFHQVAEMHAFSSVELALKKRAGTPPRTKGLAFKMLLRRAVADGWIRDGGFHYYKQVAERQVADMQAALTSPGESAITPELRSYVETLTETLPSLRNELAHGSARLAPSGKGTLAVCGDLINQIFTDS